MVEKGDGHYVQNNRLVVGRNIYQKPMPKQDKGGGIIPHRRGRSRCPYKQQATGLQNAAPLLATPSIARYKNAGNPRLRGKGKCGKEFGVTPCKQTINML